MGFFGSAEQTVTAEFPVGQHGNVKERNAVWPLIIEKAYAQQKGGISKINKGGNVGDAIKHLTDKKPSRFNPQEKSIDYIMGKLIQAKENKQMMTVSSPHVKKASQKAIGIHGNPGMRLNHAYTIVDIDPSQKRIKLFNPWGHSHPNNDGWLDIETFRIFFVEVNING